MTVIIGGGAIGEAIRSQTRAIVINSKSIPEIKKELLNINKSIAIDIIIVTAGFLEKSNVGEFGQGVIEKTVNANFVLPIVIADFSVREFPGAKLMFFSSSVVFEPREGYSAYSASKTGLEIFLRTSLLENPTRNIKIIRNSRTDTKLRWDNYDRNDSTEENLLTPNEVAKATLEFIDQTGQVIEIYKRNGEVRKDVWAERT